MKSIYLWIALAAVVAVFLVFAPERWKNIALVVLTAGIAYFFNLNVDTSEQEKENKQLDKKIDQEQQKQDDIEQELDKLEEEEANNESELETGSILNDITDSDGRDNSSSS